MNKHSRMPQLLTIGLVIIAGLICWYGVSHGNLPAHAAFADDLPAAAPQANDSDAEQLAAISVPAITLPNFEPTVPAGEGREIFMAVCLTCHSSRLVFNQPFVPRDKWEATAQKMIDVYGAVIADEHKSKAVDYVVSIRGSENTANH